MNTFQPNNMNDRNLTGNGDDAIVAFSKRFALVYYAMIGGMALLYVAFSYVVQPQQDQLVYASDPNIMLIILAANFMMILMGAMIYRIKLRSAANESSMERKIGHYQAGYIIRLAMLEAAALVNMIGYYMLGDSKFQLLFGGILLLFVLSGYPAVERIRKELGVSNSL